MHASDYGYGTDLTKCSDILSEYNSSTNSYACRANNWLFNSAAQWTITPYLSNSYSSAWAVLSSGKIYGNTVVGGFFGHNEGVRPALYLEPKLSIEAGHEGTSTDPYRINIS